MLTDFRNSFTGRLIGKFAAFVANLPVSLPVKEFWKSVNIWGSYGQEFGVLFFWDTVYICNKITSLSPYV